MTYEELWHRLLNVYDSGEAKAVIRWLLDVRFGLSQTDLYMGKVETLSEADQQALASIMGRLEKGEPVQYVLGAADFCGRSFHVAPGVLIPRPETAELCEWIVRSDKSEVISDKRRVLDIGTGSGCIAITLALDLHDCDVEAWDISETALSIAQENAERLGAKVRFKHQDVLSPLTSHLSPLYNLIVSNPPYINKALEIDEMGKNVLDYEPHEALFGPQEQPDLFYRRIGDYAKQTLAPGGQLYFELNPMMAETVCHYLSTLGFQEIELRDDQFGKQRFLKANKI